MFVGFFIVKGGQTFVANTILGTGLPPYGILLLMMLILFVLGMFIDWVGILLLTVPIFLPIMKSLEWDGLSACRASRRRMCRCGTASFHGQHADGVSVAAVRLFAVLSEKRRAARNHDGDDLPRGDEVHGAAVARATGSASYSQIICWLPSVLYAR